MANPEYLRYLQLEGYFNDLDFIHYLIYLRDYWKEPRFMSILISARSPKCLGMVNMLTEGIDLTKDDWKNDILKEMEKNPDYVLNLAV